MSNTIGSKEDRLTAYQRRLVRELDEISSHLGLDYQNISGYEREARTPHLERIRRHLIIGEVVGRYTLIDEFLNVELCRYFFGTKKSFIRLWKTKRFQDFNYHILESLSLLEKLRYVKSIRQVPRAVASDIERLNTLRNGLAHAFFPENLKKSQPAYKGKNIFTVDGIKLLSEDMLKISEFFVGIRLGDI